ncbi:midasin-like [Cocos nucifera]|nr:midasin-like [Cocos nucifera]
MAWRTVEAEESISLITSYRGMIDPRNQRRIKEARDQGSGGKRGTSYLVGAEGDVEAVDEGVASDGIVEGEVGDVALIDGILVCLQVEAIAEVEEAHLDSRDFNSTISYEREYDVVPAEMKERENKIEIREKLEVFKANAISLRSENAELNNKLIETESTIAYLKRTQKESEAALEEKQNQINGLAEKAAESTASNLQITNLTELLKEKEAKIEEMKHHLSSLQPSENTAAETNNVGRNGNVPDYKKESVASEDVQLEERSTTGGESTMIETKQVNTGNEMASDQNKDIPKEGTWVTLQTNPEDEGLKNETGSKVDPNAGVSGDNQLEKLEVSQGSEDSVQSKETDQGSNEEAKEQSLESTNGKQIHSAGNGKTGENSNDIEGKEQHVPENGDAEKLQNLQNGNEQQLTSAGLKVAVKNEDAKMRHRHGRKTKTKSRRRQRVSKEKELEKHDSMHFEISQNDGNLVRKKESADTGKEEIYRKNTDFSDSQLNMLENSRVTGNSIVRDGRDDGDASKSKQQMLLPQHESMETVTNSHGDEISETNLESKELLQVNDGIGVSHDAGDKSELDDVKQDSVSNSGNVEMPDDSQEKTQKPEGGEGLQDHEEDGLDETAQMGDEQEMTSTDGKQEKSDDPHGIGDENKSDDDEGRIIADSIDNSKSDAEGQDGVMEQTVTVNAVSDPAQSEANSNADDHQSKPTEKKTETANSSNTGDAKDEEDKGIKENAENKNSNNIAEF